MTKIRIKNANAGEGKDIQRIVNRHGFGVLSGDNGDLVAVNPDDLNGVGMDGVERELIDDIGKHIGVSFN